MAYESSKNFLNAGILGAGAGVTDRRGFRSVNTDYIGSPEYNAQFFETFPTVWAGAYAFRKSLAANDVQSLEEWVSLFVLHYFGVIHLEMIPEAQLRKNFDPDLWTALEGTFPRVGERGLNALGMLQTDDHAVIGAYYPETVFFPARDRVSWTRSESLQPYLSKGRLVWDKCYQQLLEDEHDRQQVHVHLRAVAHSAIPQKELRDRLESFCNQKLGPYYATPGDLSPDPQKWGLTVVPPTPAELLTAYPLKNTKTDGSVVYFLVTDLPLSAPWMTTKLGPNLPSPSLYMRNVTNPRDISVKQGGRVYSCPLKDNDEIELLKDLFLPHPPFWCKVPRNTDAHAAKIKMLHDVAMQDTAVRQQEMAVCLAPLRGKFLRHFPSIFQDLGNVRATPGIGGVVEWSIPVLGKEVRWTTKPIGATGMPDTSLALWPPQVSPRWKLYAGYGIGNHETFGRWHLVDENGDLGQPIDIVEDAYVSVLHRPGPTPNRPRALLFTDANKPAKERGVLFLAELLDPSVDGGGSSSIAVDFGTSNTCVAINTGQSEVLKFSLSPTMLWGQPPDDEVERVGFVPNKWGGSKGFFPTILFSRKSDAGLPSVEPDKIKLEHLFKVDIPCLHKGIEGPFYTGSFQSFWRTHSDMKWQPADPKYAKMPWRSLFLELLLLYAHGEAFFNKKALFGKYAFTYPLAFSTEYGNTYHTRVEEAIKKVRHYCYGDDLAAQNSFQYVKVDESTAIARAIRQSGAPGAMEVFIDVGGGTADIAIRHHQDFLVLDSAQVAGKAFFRFAKRNFGDEGGLHGSPQFKRHLGRLLLNQHEELNLLQLGESDFQTNLGLFYSVCINDLEDKVFNEREEEVIKSGAGAQSYQRYRSRLFFRHLLAYSLLQACAATVAHKLTLSNGVNLVLGGNGWGLLLFAELPRLSQRLKREAETILTLLKDQLERHVSEEEFNNYLKKMTVGSVELLNESSLSKSKNSVALGALLATAADGGTAEKSPYTGVNIRDLKINNFPHTTIRWCDRWSLDEFRRRFGNMEQINSVSFAAPEENNSPMDGTLSLFTALGNTDSLGGEDNLPADIWAKVNSEVLASLSGLTISGERLSTTPINHFLSEVLYPANEETDFLDKLAETNGNYRSR